MLKFTNLGISKDSNTLLISAEVVQDSAYDYTYIDKVIIDTEETYTDGVPSSTPIYSFVPSNLKSFTIELSAAQLALIDFKSHMFFVYLKSTVHPDSPKGTVEQLELGVTLDMSQIYSTFMSYINAINIDSIEPIKFTDWYIKFKALNIASNAGHNIVAINIYNKYFKTPMLC